jgi:predicted glycoside hydrolase/deacetylase ChbG (UPF0249 family)
MTAPPNGPVRLVTRGDDAALAESANEAIRECFTEGILRNASVMAPCPALDHAAETLAGLDGLCIGAHLTLTAEWDNPTWGPVSDPGEVPSLVTDDGEFYRMPDEFFDADPDRNEVRAELTAQIRALEDAGFDLAYLDTHMALEQHREWFADELATLCERAGLVNGPETPLPPGAEGAGSGPDWLLEHLAGVDSGTYLVVGHPAYDDEETNQVVGPGHEPGDVAQSRVAQRQMFTDERVQSYVADHDIELLRYDDL